MILLNLMYCISEKEKINVLLGAITQIFDAPLTSYYS